MRCFLDKFTQLAQFLHDRRSRQFHLQPFLLQKYLSIFNYMDKISYNPFVVHSDEVVHNFSLIYMGAWFLILLLLWVYHPLRFCLCQWEKYFEFGTFVCVRLYIIPCVFVWCQREEGFSGFLSILWLLRQQQYEINVMRTISCRLLLPFHSVIFGKNVNQKKMYNSCLTVSNMNTTRCMVI